MSEIAEFTRHLGNYLPPPDIALVERAFEFSDSAHRGQFRKSGEPYITHPLAVASILSQWRLDAQGLAAALLHDVMEDTAITKVEIETSFGKPVADMVDGLSKLDQIEFNSREDAQAESFRKRSEDDGLVVTIEGPAALAKLLVTEQVRWQRVVREANIKPD